MKVIHDLTDKVKKYGAKGLAWMKFQDGNFNGGISKFFSESLQKNISEKLKVENDDILLFVGDDKNKNYKEKLIAKIKKKNLYHNCKILGHLNNEDLKMMYSCADLVISMPLKPEGFGRIIA